MRPGEMKEREGVALTTLPFIAAHLFCVWICVIEKQGVYCSVKPQLGLHDAVMSEVRTSALKDGSLLPIREHTDGSGTGGSESGGTPSDVSR